MAGKSSAGSATETSTLLEVLESASAVARPVKRYSNAVAMHDDARDFDVFVSYSRRDEQVVTQFSDALRGSGLRVWMDTSIQFGEEWRASIADAIGRSRLMLVVYSSRADQSAEVAKEVAVAASLELPIVPVRIEERAPRGALLYEMARLHWVDCVPPTRQRMEAIALALIDLLKADSDRAASRRFAETLHARRLGGGLLRRLTDSSFALAVGALLTTALLMTVHDHATGFLDQQADAGVSALRSLWLLFGAATLGSPLLLIGALGRLNRAWLPLLAFLAAVNLTLLLLLVRSFIRRAWLHWSIRRAGNRP
jgi:hypothetical protein